VGRGKFDTRKVREDIWHALPVDEVFKILKTDIRGLTIAEAEKRLKEILIRLEL